MRIEPELQPVLNEGAWQTYYRTIRIGEHNKDQGICIGVYTEGEGIFSLADLKIEGRPAAELSPQFATELCPITYEYRTYPKLEHIATKNKIFDARMNFGDVATRKLADNLYINVPLALYGTKESPYPACQSEMYAQAEERILAAEPDDKTLMLSDIIVTWNTIKYFDPYLSDLDVVWDEELTKALGRVPGYNTYNSRPLRVMMARLEDAHVNITAPDDEPRDSRKYLLFYIETINGLLVVAHSFNPEIRPGDTIKRINGEDATTRYQHFEEIISGGVHYKAAQAQGDWSRSFGGCRSVKLDVERMG